jgi:hypothetical protein
VATLAVIGISVFALLFVIVMFQPQAPQSGPEAWVSVSYADLVDQEDLTQSGETISEERSRLAAGDTAAKGQLQPFLEPLASLLPDALDMVRGPAARPARSIVDTYAAGSARPAWVDLLRGGRYVVTFDGDDLATVFAPGQAAKEAYDGAVGVLRHPLGALQTSLPGPLRVEAYAYQNDYASLELRLNTAPYSFSATSFGPPPGKKTVDLQALDAFFADDVELCGARIDPDDGLVLVGRLGHRSTLAGRPVTISDLAVAYRAAFHAGHNSAFVSLDPSKDPTRVKVNFGGALEDTTLGSVVLQSDMRFKTLASGLDPATYADLRRTARSLIPGFMTVSERDLAAGTDQTAAWVGTRFWFYPDAVEVLSDLEGRTAFLGRTRFTADAERSRADFATAEEFNASKKSHLSASTRANIDDLNARYEDYADVFPELQELTLVARLMGICSWLRSAEISGIDLDEFLAGELPACSTPRDKPQLLTVSVLSYARGGVPSANEVLARTEVRRIDELLDEPVGKVFASAKALTEFLTAVGGNGDARVGTPDTTRRCRDYIHSREHLRTFAHAVAERMMDAATSPLASLSRDLKVREVGLDEIKRELDRLRTIMAASTAQHNAYLDRYNALVDEYNTGANEHRALALSANRLSTGARTIMTIEGGINLSPKDFKVTRRGTSPELERVRAAALSSNVAGLKRSPKSSGRPMPPTVRYAWHWNAGDKTQRSGAVVESGTDAAGSVFSASRATLRGDWTDRVVLSSGRSVERVYSAASKQLRIANYDDNKPETFLVAQRDASGRILFKRRDPSSLMPMTVGRQIPQ